MGFGSGSILFILLMFFNSVMSVSFAFDKNAFNEVYAATDSTNEKNLYHNFFRVLSGIVVTKQTVPIEVRKSVNTVMKELLNGQPRRQGYKSYLYLSMLQVKESTTEVQLKNMLEIIQSMSPTDSDMVEAVKVIIDWLQTANGKRFLDIIWIYVKNLFQNVRKPGMQLLPSSMDKTPGVLPAEVGDLGPTFYPEGKNYENNRAELGFDDKESLSGDGRLGRKKAKPAEEYQEPDFPDNNEYYYNRYPGNGQGDRYPGNGQGDRYPDHHPGDKYPGHRPGDKYPGHRPGDKYPDHRPGDKYPDHRPGDRYPDHRPGDKYPDHRPEDRYPDHRPGDRYPGHRPSGSFEDNEIHHGNHNKNKNKPSIEKICLENIGNNRAKYRKALEELFI